jgi:CxxC-x17-CxxC domain-containing protein
MKNSTGARSSHDTTVFIGNVQTKIMQMYLYPWLKYIIADQHCMSNTMERKGFGGPRNFGPREMTKTVCSDCGKECEVPFKPTEGRPVYCRDCLPKHRKPRF